MKHYIAELIIAIIAILIASYVWKVIEESIAKEKAKQQVQVQNAALQAVRTKFF